MTKKATADLPVLAFPSPKDWKKWLEKNHAASNGIWLRFFKKNSGVESVTYPEALDEALCVGWIDSQLQKYDEQSFLRKFTPRRAKSPWSKINQGHVERLMAGKRMQPTGLREVEAARADGRWAAAYSAQRTAEMPDDFKKALARNKKAKAFFDTLSRANVYAIYFRLQAAKKPETRERWVQRFIAMLESGEPWHAQVIKPAKKVD